MLHSESPLCQEHGRPEHSYNPIPEADEEGILTLEYTESILAEGDIKYPLSWPEVQVLLNAQHQVDLKAQEEAIGKAFASRPLSITVESANKEKAEAVKAEREKVESEMAVLIRVAGKIYQCACLCSVFQKRGEKYVCILCGTPALFVRDRKEG